jgi:DNA-binding ferritin-like protein (Dps family)
MHALVVRERILGPDHKDTIFGLMYRGAVYADTHAYQRCIDLWKYAFQLRRATPRSSVLAHEYLFTLQALCKLFWEIYDEDTNSNTVVSVRFSDVIDVLEMAVAEVKEATSVDVIDLCTDELAILLQLCLHLVHLLCRLPATHLQSTLFLRLVHVLVRAGARNAEGRTLLHLAVDPSTSLVADEFYSELPNIRVIAILLEAGSNVDDVDSAGNTALHVAVSVKSDLPESISFDSIVGSFLQYGAHIDLANSERKAVIDFLPPGVCILNYVSLKCLAARAIRQCSIVYDGVIPSSLISFVNSH